jgi:Zn-dependent membrane protease YugP
MEISYQKKSVHIPKLCAHQIKHAILRPRSLCIYVVFYRLVSQVIISYNSYMIIKPGILEC